MAREQQIQRAAAKAAAAHCSLVRLMVEARAEGMPLREIAKAAGVSHEQVRRLTQ